MDSKEITQKIRKAWLEHGQGYALHIATELGLSNKQGGLTADELILVAAGKGKVTGNKTGGYSFRGQNTAPNAG